MKGEDFLDMNLVDAYRDKVVVVILTEGDSNNIWNILKKSNIDEKTAERVHLIRWSKFGKYSDNLNEFINCIDNIGIDNIGLVFWDSWLGTEIYNSKNDSEAVREGSKAIQYILKNGINYEEKTTYNSFSQTINRNYPYMKNKIEEFIKTMMTTTLPI